MVKYAYGNKADGQDDDAREWSIVSTAVVNEAAKMAK